MALSKNEGDKILKLSAERMAELWATDPEWRAEYLQILRFGEALTADALRDEPPYPPD